MTNSARALACLLSISLAFTPSLSAARETVRTVKTSPGLTLPSLAVLPSLKPGLLEVPAVKLPSLQASKALELPALADAQSPAAAVKAEAAVVFDAASGLKASAAEPVLAQAAGSPSAALQAPTAAAASPLKAVPLPRSSWKSTARRYLPAAFAAALTTGAAVLLNAYGQLDAGLTAMLLAAPFMAGTVGGSGRSSGEKAFLANLYAQAAPGQALPLNEVGRLAQESGLDTGRALTLLNEETAAGRIASFSNGAHIRLELDAQAEKDSQARKAVEDALAALPLREDRSLESALRGLADLGVARDRAAISDSDNVGALERQLNVLRLNYAFDVLRRLGAADKRTLPFVTEYLGRLTFDVIDRPAAANTAVALELSKLMNGLPNGSDQRVADGAKALRGVVHALMPPSARPALSRPRGIQDDVLEALERRMVWGFEIYADIKQDIAEELKVQPPVVEAALRHLAANNMLARVSRNRFLFTSLDAFQKKAASSRGPELRAVHAAQSGLRYLNGGTLLEHALAESDFAQAVDLVQDSPSKPWADFAQQAELLRKNAWIKIVGDVLDLYEKGLTPEAKHDSQRRRVAEWRAWLETGYVSNDVDQPAIHEDTRDWLVELLDALRPQLRDQKSRSHGELLSSALKSTSAYVASLKAQADAPKQLPAPQAPAGLIARDDKNYKSLNEFGFNLTAAAARGELEPMIGRRKEIRQTIKILLRGKKNNPVVIGEAGVGKTAVIEGLAQMLVAGKLPADGPDAEMLLPEELKGKNIFRLNLNALVAGTTLRGQFEERLKKVLDEVAASNGKVILFVDEVHMLLGLGSAEGTQDAAETLLQYMARPGFAMIGATTLDRYKKIEKKGQLKRRFGAVMLQPPTPGEAERILMSAKTQMEKQHKVTISEDVVKTSVQLAARYITDRHLPDSALDLLDDAATEVQLKNSERRHKGEAAVTEVTRDDIGQEIALRLGIPAANMTGDEKERLKRLPERLGARVIGQDDAVQAVTRAVRRSRLGYKDPNQPDMFVFLGPTGVGKTELVRALAADEFGHEKNMTRIDMSEYAEKHNLARLIGAPPGYVGHEEGGALTEAVKRNPYQIILLDEIDKAHPDVWNLLLQIKEDGRLTDGEGRTVDFKNVIIIATANYKGEHSQQKKPSNPIGFGTHLPKPEEKSQSDKQKRKDGYVEDFREAVRPEVFGRIGERNVVAFNELESEHYERIAALREADLNKRLAHKSMRVKLTEDAVKQILAIADTPENRRYGARPLKQTVEEQVVEALVEADLDGLIGDGDSVVVDYDAKLAKWVAKKAQAS